MDNQRLFLYLGLGFLIMLIWQTWQIDYVLAPQQAAEQVAQANQNKLASTNAETTDGAVPTVSPSGELIVQNDVSATAQTVEIKTDVFGMSMNSQGADLSFVDLIKYPISLEEPDNAIRQIGSRDDRYMGIQTGLQASEGVAPNHLADYSVAAEQYEMKDGEDGLQVDAQWSDAGINVTKSWIFNRDAYDYRVQFTVTNNSQAVWTGWQYRQLQRSQVADTETSTGMATYTGGVISSPEDVYEKVALDDIAEEPLKRTVTGGWAAMIEHYFANAVIPDQSEENTYYTRYWAERDRYILGLSSKAVSIQPGESHTFATTFYAGPKLQDNMEALAPNLRLTVDYGFLTVLAQPLFWLLNKIHSIVNNWGWSIILLTVVVKGLFYKLSEMSYKSMARMKKLQPKMEELKARLGDDREAMGRATMEMYKKEKVNPLGGCLPMIIQIPVFIALYWTLMESVELRQAPWIGWIKDLSVMDPYYILPVLMGISMFVQQRLNPAPVDPIQQKIFMFMPLIFTVFFAFFPAGLVLYWISNNVLSISQQWYITRIVIGVDSAPAKKS